MRYLSTRGAWRDDPQPFRAILLEGLAPDGGLAVPQHYPRFSAETLATLRGKPYAELASAVLSPFISDIAPGDLRAIIVGLSASRRLHLVSFTERCETVRLIHVRRVNARER